MMMMVIARAYLSLRVCVGWGGRREGGMRGTAGDEACSLETRGISGEPMYNSNLYLLKKYTPPPPKVLTFLLRRAVCVSRREPE